MRIDALVTREIEGRLATAMESIDLPVPGAGEVVVAIEWSTLNYKDGLALTRGKVMQRYPLVGGIDFAGTVERSEHPGFSPGDRVVATGWGLSQTHDGGYAEKACVPGDWLIALPHPLTTRDAMAIGTAGLTAMLAVLALERGGLAPDSGTIVVSGANGGVGSIAIALLADLGYRVVASTGRPQEADYLAALGAVEIIDRSLLASDPPPIAAPQWAGGIDTAGSRTLANMLARTAHCGVVAACGLAGGMDLPASVLPFILRGVTLAGIDSVQAPWHVRRLAWTRLAQELDLAKLAIMTTEIELSDVPTAALAILENSIRGRTLVRVA